MIHIKGLKIGINKKEILSGVDLKFELGKNYCLLGSNGSGKSSLSSFLMGAPKYEYISGSVEINNKNLLELTPEERCKEGLFLSFQNIPEIKGIRLGEFLRTIYNISIKNNNINIQELSPFVFKRFIRKHLEELHINENFLDRELNVGFSGGEKRKIEILQMKLIGPKYIILDEIDSGLDLDAFKIIAKMLCDLSNKENTLIIITHYFKILDFINIDKVYIIKEGKIVKNGDIKLVDKISDVGFNNI